MRFIKEIEVKGLIDMHPELSFEFLKNKLLKLPKHSVATAEEITPTIKAVIKDEVVKLECFGVECLFPLIVAQALTDKYWLLRKEK